MTPYPLTIFCGEHLEAAQLVDQAFSTTAEIFAQMKLCGDCSCRGNWSVTSSDGRHYTYFEALKHALIRPTLPSDEPIAPL